MLKRMLTLICICAFSVACTHRDKIYKIRLKSNPTTGYMWLIKSYDHNLLTLKSHRFEPSKTHLIGAGGHQVWEFTPTNKALKAPQTTAVKLVYARPWELKHGKQPARVMSVNVVIH